jgi:hypothetical protein
MLKTSHREVPVRVRVIILDRYRQNQKIPEMKAATRLSRSIIRSIINRYKECWLIILINKPYSGLNLVRTSNFYMFLEESDL